jgi:hypothetical protein
MVKVSSDVYGRIGLVPEQRLRWLLGFGNLDLAALNGRKRAGTVQEARTFMLIQQTDPGFRPRLRSWPPLRDDTPGVLSDAEVWSAQGWLKKGLDSLRRGEIWDFIPSIRYELDAHKGLFWVRLRADSLLELFKALVYDALRDARFKVRLCPECKRPFVPIRRQAYCSARCSQAVRTRKWRTAHPEKNRAIRRRQYRKSTEAKLALSKGSKIRVGKSYRRSPK